MLKQIFYKRRNSVNSEVEILRHINLLKELRGDCNKIQAQLKGICSLINAEWNPEEAPAVSSIQNAIEMKLINYRSKLAQLRGE